MADDNQANWDYKPGEKSAGKAGSSSQTKTGDSLIAWTASEYIEHDRNASWYILLALATVGLSAGIYFLTKDIFAAVVIAVVGVIMGIFASRKPRKLEYELSASGLRIGEKSYNYNLFRTFSMIKEGSLISIVLLPAKRLIPPVSAYIDAQDEEKITKIIGEHLPYEERRPDYTDRLSRHLRF